MTQTHGGFFSDITLRDLTWLGDLEESDPITEPGQNPLIISEFSSLEILRYVRHRLDRTRFIVRNASKPKGIFRRIRSEEDFTEDLGNLRSRLARLRQIEIYLSRRVDRKD